MPVRVVTYTNPRTLDRHPLLPDLMELVQICATPSLKAGMVTFYGRHQALLRRTIEARNLFDELLKEWNSDATRISQHARLTRLIESLRQNPPFGWANQLRAFRRNQRDVLLAMRVLAEADISPSDLQPTTVDEQIFQRLWAEMEQKDKAMGNIRMKLHKYMTHPVTFREDLYAALYKAISKSNSERKPPLPAPNPEELRVERLVLHGYYFITPLQGRFFQLAENAGLELIFLNCYDPAYPTAHRTWEAFFDRANGLPGKSEWEMPPVLGGKGEPIRTVLGDLFEGRQPTCPPNGSGPVQICRYADFGAFLRQFAADHPLPDPNPYSPVYLSPEADTVSHFLREYYPGKEDVQNRHFLAYPIGQLLFHLHRMWDEEEANPSRRLKISARPLFECFASGWLQTGGLNGRNYLHDLEEMLPFFEGCETLDEWRVRAELLAAIKIGVVARFDSTLPPSHPNRRFHQFLGNPLERISHFKVKAESVTAIVALMEQLFQIAEALFNHPEIDMTEHLARIESLLLQGVKDSELLEEERRLLTELRERLLAGAASAEKFLPQDLALAIAFYLGGDLIPDDAKQPGELDPDHLVGPLDRLDGAPLTYPDQEIHLCVLGEKSLPKRKGAFPWPLTAQSFAHMATHPAVRMLVLREQESANLDRYLLFYGLRWAEEVTLSWISNWQDEILGPSPYLVLLEPYCAVVDREIQPWGAGIKVDLDTKGSWDPSRAPDNYERLPHDAVAEYALCPRRFFYSFLAQESPSFRSDFHHQFLFGNLARAFSSTAGQRTEKVLQEMEPLFPQWSGLLRQDLVERSVSARKDYDRYDGYEYPRSRFALQFAMLRDDEMGRALKVLDDPDADQRARTEMRTAMADAGPLMKPNPTVACRYCPHIGRCDAAQYPVDDE